jgi:myo-inositol 2-dehydrogenase/D-chiro-inositol 1-dehydrogenase
VWREHSYGFPQERQDFADRVLSDAEPLERGEDGRAVPEIVLAAHESAGTGRRVEWPYVAPRDKTPQQMWGR